MPSSDVRTFNDADEYGAAIRAARTEITVTGRGTFAAKIVRIDLHDLWMQRYSDALPRVARVATSPARTIISFPTQPGPPVFLGGREAPWGTLNRFEAGQDVFQRSTGAVEWASMSLAVDDFATAVSAITHRDTRMQTAGRTIWPASNAMAKLQCLHAAACGLAESAPMILAKP